VSDLDVPDHQLSLQSIAIQKGFNKIGSGPIQPGDTLQYQLNFQVSDYFSFDQIVITDWLSDGQSVDESFAPQLTFQDQFGGGTTSFILGESYTFDFQADGRVEVLFDVSTAMAGIAGQDGILQGGYTQGTSAAPAVGQIVFRAVVDDEFRLPPTGT
jgi:hypothetical protein